METVNEVKKLLDKKPQYGVFLGAFLLVLGLLLAWIIPRAVVSSASRRVAENHTMVTVALEETESELTLQRLWFTPAYFSLGEDRTAIQQLDQARAKMQGLGQEIDVCSHGGMSDRLNCYEEIQSLLEEVQRLIAEVSVQLSANKQLRDTAQAHIDAFSIAAESAKLSVLQRDFNAEAAYHLTKYTDEPLQTLVTANKKLHVNVRDLVIAAQTVLPAHDNTQSIGDPRRAMQYIDQAKAVVDETNTLMQQVTASLQEMKVARAEAGNTLQAANIKINAASSRLTTINSQYGWGFELALESASVSFVSAGISRDAAQSILDDSIDGVVDWIAGYNKASESLGFAQTSLEQANRQVSAYETATANILKYPTQKARLQNTLNAATSSKSTLTAYHAVENWRQVVSDYDRAVGNIATADSLIVNAQEYVGVGVQRFTDAERFTGTALETLSLAESAAIAVTTKTSQLESARSQWSQAEANAASTINNERPGSNSEDCAYDTTTRENFQSAETKLTLARQNAASKHWEEAVGLANEVSSLATGVKSMCQSAYDDEMADRTRIAEEATREQREENEEATRSAQAAQSSDDDDDNSYFGSSGSGFDSGSSSSGSSSGFGGSSDGGGWPSGSSGSSSDGGGWGGSSGSSDGGGWGD